MQLGLVQQTLLTPDIRSIDIVSTMKQRTEIINGKLELVGGNRPSYKLNTKIPYNEFLIKIQKITNIPIRTFHKALLKYNETEKIDDTWFTESTLSKFVQKFHEWEQEYYIHKFSYKQLNVETIETALTDNNGNVRENILQADVGVLSTPDDVSDKFLYDRLIYDSPLEKKNIESSDISEVIVYGKIPRRSIKIPVFWGGTYSPDFMYVVRNKDGSLQYNFIIETKDVSSNGALRDDEKKRILCGMKFFKQLKNEGYNVSFKEQLKADNVVAMIKKICEN